jgi:hypothetical protein
MSQTIISGYSVVYKHMTQADRDKLEADIKSVLAKNIEYVEGCLKTETEKIVSALYRELLCNPFGEVIKENSGPCEFINQIQDHVWKLMMEQNPKEPSKYALSELISEWRARCPDEFKEVVGNDVAEQLAKLQDRLDLEIRCNKNRY